MTVTIEKNDIAKNYLPLPDEIIRRYDLKVGDKLVMLQRKRGVLVVPLPYKMVKNRNGEDVEQLYEVVQRNYRGVDVEYVSCYYLDYYVDENTGMIDYSRLDKFYTSEQSDYDTKSFKEAYLDALDGEDPQEKIIDNIDPTTLHDEIDFGCSVGNEEDSLERFKVISELVFSLGIGRNEYSHILQISTSSLYRYLKDPQRVSAKCQDRSVVIYNVINKGISTFGDKSKFSHWLFCKNIALGGPKPIEMLSTDEGTKQVDFCLNRIEWGIFA